MKDSLVGVIFVNVREALLETAVNACTSLEIEGRLWMHEKTGRGTVKESSTHAVNCDRFPVSVCYQAPQQRTHRADHLA